MANLTLFNQINHIQLNFTDKPLSFRDFQKCLLILIFNVFPVRL